MKGTLRFLQLLSIVVWVGGIIFFAFVLAPVSFQTLPSVHLAGAVVGAALRVLDRIGLTCGIIFLFATALFAFKSRIRPRRNSQLELLFAAAMMLATAYLHWSILPTMERDRAPTGGDIAAVAPENPARVAFDRLHQRSEHTEEFVLLAGLGVVFLLSRDEAWAGRN